MSEKNSVRLRGGMPVEKGDIRTLEEMKAARGRFSDFHISYLWHADGTPFTDEEYRERGIDPPPPGEQKKLLLLN